MVETKNTEIRYKTTDPKRMINKYTVGRVLKSWTEDFVDEGTGDVVTIERNEVLFERGTLITQDVLAQLKFHKDAGDITEVEVSNQRRVAFEYENTSMRPFLAIADMDGKKKKFLYYATKIATALILLKDYIELNYSTGFFLTSIREFETNIILIDTLKKVNQDDNVEEEENQNEQKKFYQIDFNVEIDGEQVTTNSAVVHTLNVDRAMMLINDYLIKNEKRRADEAKEKNRDYTVQTYSTSIESAKPIPIGVYISREFSEAYANE
jgi:hypothetical protein